MLLYNTNFKPKSILYFHPPDEKIDLLMHGSPCQDFSRSGLKKGGTKGSGTRSSLLLKLYNYRRNENTTKDSALGKCKGSSR